MVPVWKILSFLLNEICMVILWQDSYGRGNLRKSYWNTVGRKFPIWECLFVHREKGLFLSVLCGRHQIGWKETKSWSDVERTKQRSWFGRANIIPWPCIPGMYLTTMSNRQRSCRQLQNHFWIANFSGESREITIPSKSSYFFMVLWHGWSCQEMCGTILWVGKQDDSTTLQSINSMHRWPPL